MMTMQTRSRNLLLGLGALLAILVAVNATEQYLHFTEMREKFRARFAQSNRPAPPTPPAETNLVVNGTASFALLAALGVIGMRSRYLLRAQRWEQQLTQGRAVQSHLIPPAEEIQKVHASAEFVPAMEVGGDLYDVFPTPDGRVAFALGDVSGKGLPAALLMGMIHGAVRSNAWHTDAASHEAFARQLNSLLRSRSENTKFASLFWGCYDPMLGELSYINAGHCPGYVVRRGGIVSLDSTGPVLGILPQSRFHQVSMAIEPGDLLVLYSDGIVEAVNKAGEEFGEERLQAALARCAGMSAAVAKEVVLREYKAFLGNTPPEDDMTLLVLEAHAPAAQLTAAA